MSAVFGSQYIHPQSTTLREARRVITHHREQLRLSLQVSEEDTLAYEQAQQVTKLFSQQQKRLHDLGRQNDPLPGTSAAATGTEAEEEAYPEESFHDPSESFDDSSNEEEPLVPSGQQPNPSPPPPPPSQSPPPSPPPPPANVMVYPEEFDEATTGHGTSPPKGNELALIPEFKGDGSADPEVWIRRVENTGTTYKWFESAYQSAATLRFSGEALKWLEAISRNLEYPYRHYNGCLEGPDGPNDVQAQAGPPAVAFRPGQPALPRDPSWPKFKKAFFERFRPQDETIAATNAIMNLRQGSNEGVHAFYDRCVVAVDKKNFQYDRTAKTGDAYKSARDVDLFSFMAAGLKPEIRKMALGGQRPAKIIKELLAYCMNAEVILKASQSQLSVSEIGIAPSPNEEASPTSVPDNDGSLAVSELRKEIDAVKTNMKCFKCGQIGHMRRDCKNRPQVTGGGGGNRPPRNNPGKGNPRGRGRGSGPPRGRGGGNWKNPRYQGYNQSQAQRGWVPQANFGQPGGYYQNNMIQGPPIGPQGYFHPYSTPGYSHNPNSAGPHTSSIVDEPWAVRTQGN